MAETRYPGPRPLGDAISRLVLSPIEGAEFHREGLRENFEYRDLGWAEASYRRIGAKHTRAIKPFEAETGWHWHDMTGHFIYVLKGWIKFRFDGRADEIIVRAGSSLSQPAGVAHNVIGYSDDLELIEVNIPADYATNDLPE